ncbi:MULTISPECIES: hypothetical protein [unclassified Streptomyces]|uniref:hypothetical protein n=1 Tax=unclassified Streptomyces TaxID=2593676 RepID=UPI0019687ADF|nr:MULTISPECIES: hypothetical protein [unclassified Streptomyces]
MALTAVSLVFKPVETTSYLVLRPHALRDSARPLLDWLETTGCSRVALHFNVDAVDSNEIVLGLGIEPHGLTGAEVPRIVADIDRATDVVGSTIAELSLGR